MKKLFFCCLLLQTFLPLATKAQQYDPPWNPAPQGGVNFTIHGIDNAPDLYGDPEDAQLVLFFAGNQYMVIDDLLGAFKKAYPQYQRIFAETLPPGILARQIETGSLVVGNLRLHIKPDVYTAGKEKMEASKDWFSHTTAYARNRLAIMVAAGNPKEVHDLKDLGRADVKVSMPNPAWEGIAKKIEEAYRRAGGEKLRQQIMETKVKNGTTRLTQIHHRQTPLNILNGVADAGPVWYTEAWYHKLIGHPVEAIELPDTQNIFATYVAGALRAAPHPQAAADFLDFLKTSVAQAVYRKYGFEAL